MTIFVKDKSFYKNLLLLTIPIAFQNIIAFAIGLADNIMVSSLGETAVSGVYVANNITILLQRLTIGLSSAMTILAAQYWGKKDIKSMKIIVGIGVQLALAASFALSAAVFLFPHQILSFFADERDVILAGIEYARIICFTYVLYCFTDMLISAMRCVEVVRIGMITSIVSFVINIFLNWVMIYGRLGFPQMGVTGAALATLITRIIQTAIIFYYVFMYDKKLEFRLIDIFKVNRTLYYDFIRYGLPVTLGSFAWGINLAVQGAIIGRLGSISIAAVSIAGNVFNIISVGMYGTASATSIIIGKTVGSGDIDRVKQYARTLQVLFVGIGLVSGALIFSTRGLIPIIYTDMTSETLRLASNLLIILAVMSVGTAYQMSTLTGVVRAGGATSFVLFNDLIFVWTIVLPSAYIASAIFHAPTEVVYICLKCDQILKCIVAAIKVNRYDWIKTLTR